MVACVVARRGTTLALAAGGLFALRGSSAGQTLVWGTVIAVMAVSLAVEIVGQLRRRELTALVEATPRDAHRREGDTLVDVAADDVVTGDHLVVRPGEAGPVDAAFRFRYGSRVLMRVSTSDARRRLAM